MYCQQQSKQTVTATVRYDYFIMWNNFLPGVEHEQKLKLGVEPGKGQAVCVTTMVVYSTWVGLNFPCSVYI